MDYRFEENAEQLLKKLEKKGKDLKQSFKPALSKVALLGINLIEDRTEKGTGYKGGKFKRYSENYAKFRRKKGRGKKVDLQFSGRMLGSMTSKADSRKATIFFTRGEEAKKAAFNDKTRPFFGFNRKDKKRLAKRFIESLE